MNTFVKYQTLIWINNIFEVAESKISEVRFLIKYVKN